MNIHLMLQKLKEKGKELVSFLTEMCNKYSFARSYYKNILKVLKGTFREATDVYGFIRYNPSLTFILRNGVEIRDIADVLGHKDIQTTENYYISSTENIRKNVTDSYEKAINLEVIDKIIKYKISI